MKNSAFLLLLTMLLVLGLVACGGDDDDTTDGDTADGDATDGDAEDGDTADGDTSDGDSQDVTGMNGVCFYACEDGSMYCSGYQESEDTCTGEADTDCGEDAYDYYYTEDCNTCDEECYPDWFTE